MRFTVEMVTEGSDFDVLDKDDVPVDGVVYGGSVAHALRRIADTVDDEDFGAGTNGIIRDSNGGKIGEWKITR